MKFYISTLLATTIVTGVFAQKSDGSARSLVKSESEFSARLSKSGSRAAYDDFASSDALVFRPNPINAKTYYESQPESSDVTWTPSYARVSRSGDWGFTTGPYRIGDNQYGQYLSVWKAKDGKWKLDLDLGISHNKPLNKVSPQVIEPKDAYKPIFLNDKQRATGANIIATTEKTLDATLKSYGVSAFAGFINSDVRILFPGYEPILGKDKAIAFFNSMLSKATIKTTKVDKSDGGDLAYSYGLATLDYKAELRESFNYVFIYERQADHNWNLSVMVFAPAER